MHSLRVLGLFLLLLASQAAAQRVVVISDLNPSYGSTKYSADVDRAIARVIELKPDLVLATGDLVAGQRPRRHLKRKQLEAMWTSFHRHVSEPLAAAGIPLAVTPGNHDASVYSSFALEREIFREQWSDRQPQVHMLSDEDYPLRYAFSFADLLFISLDITRPGALSPQQMEWLTGLLQQHGPTHSYRVVFSHLPLWAFAQKRERDIVADPALEALLQDNQVDLWLSGHHHVFYPGYRDHIAHIAQSCLGAGARRLIGERKRAKRSFTLLDFGSEQVSVSAFTGPTFDTTIDIDTLPKEVASRQATLIRLDRAPLGATRAVPASQ